MILYYVKNLNKPILLTKMKIIVRIKVVFLVQNHNNYKILILILRVLKLVLKTHKTRTHKTRTHKTRTHKTRLTNKLRIKKRTSSRSIRNKRKKKRLMR